MNEETNDDRPLNIGLLWRYADQSPIYADWSKDQETLQFHILKDYHQTIAQHDLDVLVTHMHYRWDELTILRETLQAKRVAVLVLADGILEFRNTWQNPGIPPGSMLQPAVAHKIATLGPAQSRLLSGWGNLGKCENVGLPRLDDLISSHHWWADQTAYSAQPTQHSAQPLRLLVCSATTPAFDDEQWEVTLQAYADLKNSILQWNSNAPARTISVTWRVAERIQQHLELPPRDTETTLHQAIEASDAVITSPSTIQLEAMVCRRPSVVLDYFPVPRYLPSAWSIHSADQISSVLKELISGSPARDQFQETILRDQLWTWSPAQDRLTQLIRKMGHESRLARQQERALNLSDPILSDQVSVDASYSENVRQFFSSVRPSISADSLEDWVRSNEVQAAIHRAENASNDRADLVRLDQEIRVQKDNYEAIVSEKQEIIEELGRQIQKTAERHDQVSELLEARNREFERVQQRIQELSDARIEDHKMLAEAHADAKAKQQRVNELRERSQDLLQRMQQAQQRADRLAEHHQALQGQLHEALERSKNQNDKVQQLNSQIEQLVTERKQLYQRLKKANQ